MKSLVWLAASLEDVKAFPDAARREIGYQLFRIQSGLEPSDWKPIPSVGRGVKDIRIHRENQYRVIYTATFKEAVYVSHTFVKKSGKTLKRDVEVAAARYRHLIKIRKEL